MLLPHIASSECQSGTLTTGADKIVGTSADNESYKAVASALSSEATLNGTDQIDGGDGFDTMRVDVNGSFAGFTADKGFMKNVERIELTNGSSIARTFSTTGITGATQYALLNEKGVTNLSDLSAAGITVKVIKQAEGSVTAGFTTDAVKGTADALNLYLEGNGAAKTTTAAAKAVTVNAAGIENLTVEAVGANVVDLSNAATKTIVAKGTGSLNVTAVNAGITSFDASAVEGTVEANIAAGTSITAIKSGKGNDTLVVDATKIAVNATIDAGAGTDIVALTNLAATLQPVMAGVETLEIRSTTADSVISGVNVSGLKSIVLNSEGALTGLTNGLTLAQFAEEGLTITAAGANAGSITATNKGALSFTTVADTADTKAAASTAISTAITANEVTAATFNVGANTVVTGNASVSGAAELTIKVASAKDTAGEDLTAFGTVGNTNTAVTAAKAQVVTVDAAGRISATINAGEAQVVNVKTGATVTGSAKTDALVLNTGKATNVKVDAGGVLNLTGSTLSKAEQVTLTAARALTGVDLAAVNTLNVSGVATTSAITVGKLGATTQEYGITVNASGLKAGLTVDTVDTKGAAVALNVADVTGLAKFGAVTAGNVTIKATNQLGATEVGAISSTAGSTVSIAAAGILGKGASDNALKVGAVSVAPTAGKLTGAITLDLTGTSGKFDVGALTAGTVTVNADTSGGAIDGAGTQKIGDISANTAVVKGNSLAANTFKITADSITFTGGLAADALTLAGQTAGTSNKVTETLNLTTGLGNDTVAFTTKAAALLETTLTGTVALGDGTDALTLTIGGAAATTDGTGSLNASALVVTGAETITINGSDDVNTIVGTAYNDTIDGKAGADIITGGKGKDALTGGTGADTFIFAAGDSGKTAETVDVVADFTTTSDTIKLGLAGSGTNYVETDLNAAAAFNLATAIASAEASFNGTIKIAVILNSNAGASGSNGSGFLVYDSNGDKVADMVVELTGVNALSKVAATDFVV